MESARDAVSQGLGQRLVKPMELWMELYHTAKVGCVACLAQAWRGCGLFGEGFDD